MMQIWSFFVILSATLVTLTETSVTFCNYDDSNCIVKSANSILKNDNNGVEEIGLIQFDPLNAKKLLINQGAADRPIRLTLELKNFQIDGLKDAKFYKMSGFGEKPEGNKLDLRLKVPSVWIHGPYVGEGKILIFPVYGNGNANVTLKNADIKMKILTKKVEKDGKTHTAIEKFKMDFTVTRLFLQFEGLFNGDKLLGDNMNALLNNNWELLLEELKPSMVESIGKIIIERVNKVFLKVPYSELFLKQNN